MNISEYIRTGIIESYVLGLATAEDAGQYERMVQLFPEIKIAQSEFESRLEAHIMSNEVPPPGWIRGKVEDRLRELPAIRPVSKGHWNSAAGGGEEYLHIEGSSTHIKVHKGWRPVFIAFVILTKLLLAAAIYYFVQFQSANREINKLQQEVKERKAGI